MTGRRLALAAAGIPPAAALGYAAAGQLTGPAAVAIAAAGALGVAVLPSILATLAAEWRRAGTDPAPHTDTDSDLETP